MQQDSTNLTFTHVQQLQYSLTCALKQQNTCLHIYLHVPTQTFPKIYTLSLSQQQLHNPMYIQLKLIYSSIMNIYNCLKNKQNIQIIYPMGTIKLKYTLTIGQASRNKQINLKLNRWMQGQLQQIRNIINDKVQSLSDIEYLSNRIQKLWRRQEENQKIFMKFKQDIQFKVQQVTQRITIQNTKISIIRQDINKLTLMMQKLTAIVCPIFSKINIKSEFTNQFILQDRKIMYIGDNGLWTQIIFKQEIGYKKVEVGFKIANSRKNNIVAGITVPGQIGYRSSIHAGKGQKGDRKYIGLSGIGHLYSSNNNNDQNNEYSLWSTHTQIQKQPTKQLTKQQKSNHQITLSSPILSTVRSTILNSKTHSNNQAFKPMQIIKICIDLQKQKICWKNGNKILMQTKIGNQFKNQSVVVFFQFCDTGDSIQCIDF